MADPTFTDGMRHAAEEDDDTGNHVQASYLRIGADKIDRLQAALASAAECLSARAKQFRFYSDQHMAKTPPDIRKAATNDAEAALCEVEVEAIEALLDNREHREVPA